MVHENLKRHDLQGTAVRRGELDPVVGRDAQIKRMITILNRRTKNNPVLIGEPGVGKTEIAKVLSHMLEAPLVRLQCYEGLDVHKHGHDVKAEAFLSVCKQMMAKFPKAKKVITTLRGSISASHNTWAGVLYDGNKMYETCQYQITDIVDRVGGGDSFMGGLIYGLLQYPDDD